MFDKILIYLFIRGIMVHVFVPMFFFFISFLNKL